MKVTRKSPLTGIVNTMDLNITDEQWARYERGHELIQNVFPNLTPAEREFILNGYTQEDWDTMFPAEDDEED